MLLRSFNRFAVNPISGPRRSMQSKVHYLNSLLMCVCEGVPLRLSLTWPFRVHWLWYGQGWNVAFLNIYPLLPKLCQTYCPLVIPPPNQKSHPPMVDFELAKVVGFQTLNVMSFETVDNYVSSLHSCQYPTQFHSSNTAGQEGLISSLVPDVLLMLYHGVFELSIGARRQYLE